MVLFAANRRTGIVIDAGHEEIFCVPFYEGFPLYAAQIQYIPAGKDITKLLDSMLRENDNNLSIEFRNEVVQDIKEKKSYIALDIEEERIKSEKSTFGFKYTLPNKEILKLGRELFFAPECLFDPSLLNQPYPPLPKVINDSIQACDQDIQNSLYQNIIICGGTSMFPGFKERLTLELQKLTPNKNIINIIAPEQRENYTWLGGSLFASDKYILDQWISREDYFKHGPFIIHRCL